MLRLDGTRLASEVIARLAVKPVPKCFLAGILVGDDPASVSFQKLKQQTAQTLGVDYRLYELPGTATNDDLRREVGRIAAHRTCGGVVVQLPLPSHVNRHYVLNAIPREKDPDVLSERSIGAFYAERNPVLPPAVAALEEVLRAQSCALENATVVVVGPGFLVGKPIAVWLMRKVPHLHVIYRGGNLDVLKDADLVICGVGQAGMIKPSMLKVSASIVDFSYSTGPGGKLVGDFDAEALGADGAPDRTGFYTPTPGGTGPLLVAKLLENFYTLNSGR